MPTYAQFITHIDNVIAKVTDGLTHDDFADAPWRDLYEDTDGKPADFDVIETLSECDDLFAAMVALA